MQSPFAAARGLLAASSRSAADVYGVLERVLRDCTELEGFAIWRAEDERFACVHATGARYEHYRGTLLSALDPGSPLAVARRDAVHRFAVPPLRSLHPADGAGLAIPLCDCEGVVAYLALPSRPDDEVLAQILERTELAGTALRIAVEREDDRARATFDGLTGLLTPRAFRIELAARLQASRLREVARRIALVFVDTDWFKDWNDRYGHAAGDRLLRELAAMLREHAAGPEDLVARNGGDEFCLVWSHCEKSEAIVRAEALRRAISASFTGEGVPITASIGIAAFPADAQSPEELLEAADAAMYASKGAGRNRVSYRERNGTLRTLD